MKKLIILKTIYLVFVIGFVVGTYFLVLKLNFLKQPYSLPLIGESSKLLQKKIIFVVVTCIAIIIYVVWISYAWRKNQKLRMLFNQQENNQPISQDLLLKLNSTKDWRIITSLLFFIIAILSAISFFICLDRYINFHGNHFDTEIIKVSGIIIFFLTVFLTIVSSIDDNMSYIIESCCLVNHIKSSFSHEDFLELEGFIYTKRLSMDNFLSYQYVRKISENSRLSDTLRQIYVSDIELKALQAITSP